MRTFDHKLVDSAYRRILNLRTALKTETDRLTNQLDILSPDAVAVYNRKIGTLGE